eukprot:3399638-Amphidinium_carterae.1
MDCLEFSQVTTHRGPPSEVVKEWPNQRFRLSRSQESRACRVSHVVTCHDGTDSAQPTDLWPFGFFFALGGVIVPTAPLGINDTL